jgi:hypothetical protein
LLFHLVGSRWKIVNNTYFKEDQVGYFVDGGKYSVGELQLANVTNSEDPDVVIRSTGADYLWFSMISHVGGEWHLVPIDYGTKPRIAVDAYGIQGRFLIVETDTCEFSCAQGPETYAWERFNGSEFIPAEPPGLRAQCSSQVLTKVVHEDGASDVSITTVDCKDGWAVGSGRGKHGRAAGVFEQLHSIWIELALNDSGRTDDNWGMAPVGGYYNFAIPYSLTEQLCRGVGISARWVIAAPMSRTAYTAYLRHGLLRRPNFY